MWFIIHPPNPLYVQSMILQYMKKIAKNPAVLARYYS